MIFSLSKFAPFLAIALFLGGEVLEAGNVKLLSEDSVSDNGAVHLDWEKPDESDVVVEQSASDDFEDAFVRYEGPDVGSFITGLAEGVHYFRVREAGDSEWSKTVTVTVKFFPRGKLYLILGIGAVVVLATIGTIIFGHLNTKNEEEVSG